MCYTVVAVVAHGVLVLGYLKCRSLVFYRCLGFVFLPLLWFLTAAWGVFFCLGSRDYARASFLF